MWNTGIKEKQILLYYNYWANRIPSVIVSGAFKTCIQNTKDNLKEVSRIGVNAARTYEQTSRDMEHNMPATSHAAGVYKERQERRF
jgi:hypothetical protein